MDKSSFIPPFLWVFWIGFVCAISFMEAWIKFKAPGVTLAIGLSIGIKVFKALHLIEWTLLLVSFSWVIWGPKSLTSFTKIEMVIIVAILLTQTFILMPPMTARSVDVMNQIPIIAKPHLHISYITLEIIKITLLITLTTQWVRSTIHLPI